MNKAQGDEYWLRAVKLKDISMDDKIVDILTKPLSNKNIIYFRDNISVMENVSLNERE